ncbi:methyltransferase domain-containing protein [Frankia sp. AgB1.9]|uniref:class I SAM-dependent methyltransferase n=1 Tax=unclassified Frankia TaxID=2632575 RepID=UPI00193187F6|nr:MULTISPECIES: class I SAM-dependent methyltransferase [unclassified Frankia]MBL7549239.1 methyltransferase domain-containing protein [Frankia sp. AgB1.9]MBL7619456.1 methyltransferase domain-containing protein [Frankia sp. AgB1.8]
MTVSPTTTSGPDLAAVKAKQQKTWSSGDYSVIGSRIVLQSELLVDAADLRPGWSVLDVACGAGNAAIAAARSDARVIGVDYVPELLARARERAAAEALAVDFQTGDAEALPFPAESFDAVLSVFGAMFAPDHARTADEMIRVTRPGGVIGLASWTPEGFIGEMFRTISSHVPAPKGVASPLLWGTADHLAELFGPAAAEIRSVERTCVFRFASPEDFAGTFRAWYGPTLKAFEALDDAGRTALAADLAGLARRWSRNPDGQTVALPSTYLETIITLRSADA